MSPFDFTCLGDIILLSTEGGGPVDEVSGPDGLVLTTMLLGYGAPAVTIDLRGSTSLPPSF